MQVEVMEDIVKVDLSDIQRESELKITCKQSSCKPPNRLQNTQENCQRLLNLMDGVVGAYSLVQSLSVDKGNKGITKHTKWMGG